VIENEINAATDNPLIFPEGEGSVISGGNFHGQPVAIAMDTLGIAVAELGNVSERRIERLVNPTLSGLPAFLAPNGGLNCGFMVPQYAAAAVVSENKILAHPASVDSIPTSANQEDHVSMGTIAARKAREILKHVEYVLGIELLCAAQAVDFKDKEQLGKGSRGAYETIRQHVTFMDQDRIIYPDMDMAVNLIHSGKVVSAVEALVGTLE
jgi:histidine ammonia-lyase